MEIHFRFSGKNDIQTRIICPVCDIVNILSENGLKMALLDVLRKGYKMRLLIGVSNFGKIEHAEIDITNFTIFVGNNNSGKTYMMQLIYGVLDVIPKIPIKIEIMEDEILEAEWVDKVQVQVNQYLTEHKEEIVLHIFHRPIPIEKLYIKMLDEQDQFQMEFKVSDTSVEESGDDGAAVVNKRRLVRVNLNWMKQSKLFKHRNYVFIGSDQSEVRKRISKYLMLMILELRNRSTSLFLPASRTGMLLLYKYFFSEKDKGNDLELELLDDQEKNYENELGLSTPVYDFLQFLLRHTRSERGMQENKELIDFFEQYLIDGQIIQADDETIYIPQNSKLEVPLYLSSSMVNELTPIMKVLTDITDYKYIFYDEIETCLHPLKQGEMARFLIRLNNSGRRLIVSTHSDTMAAKINNLLLLSFQSEDRESKLKGVGLEEADMLVSNEIHAYQFINNENGHSCVSEMEFRRVPYTGYDFKLFSNSAENLYEETLAIME